MSEPAAFNAHETLSRLRRSLLTLFGIALLLAGGLTYAILRGESTRNIITQSPCQRDVNSKACTDLREEVLRSEPMRLTCIPLRRAGYRCPNHRTSNGPAHIGDHSPESDEGGGNSETASPPSSQPNPPPAGGGSSNGGNGGPSNPGSPPNPPPPSEGVVEHTVGQVEQTLCNLTDPVTHLPTCP